jgi:hypothetical protein
MANTLSVTSDTSEFPASSPTSRSTLQKTDTSETLGLHIDKKVDTTAAEDNTMNMLKNEGNGTQQDTKTGNSHYVAWRIASGLMLIVAFVFIAIAVKKIVAAKSKNK